MAIVYDTVPSKSRIQYDDEGESTTNESAQDDGHLSEEEIYKQGLEDIRKELPTFPNLIRKVKEYVTDTGEFKKAAETPGPVEAEDRVPGVTYTKIRTGKKHLPRGSKSTDEHDMYVENTISPAVESWSAKTLRHLQNVKNSMLAHPGMTAQLAEFAYANGIRNNMTDTHAKELGYKNAEDYLDYEREVFNKKMLRDASAAEQLIGSVAAQVVDPIALTVGRFGLKSPVGMARNLKLAAGGAGYAGSLEALTQATEDGTITSPGLVLGHAILGGIGVPVLDKVIRTGAKIRTEGILKRIERNTQDNILKGKMNPQAAYDKALFDSGIAPREIASMIDGSGRTQHFPTAFNPLARPEILKQLRNMGYSPRAIQAMVAKGDPIEGYIAATNKNGILKKLSNASSTITSYIGEGIDNLIQPTSSALRKISPALLNGLRKNELNINLDTNEWRGIVEPFLKITSELPEKVYRALHKALINRNEPRVKDILNSLPTETPPAKGMTRLYRAESKIKKELPDWIKQEQQSSGHIAAQGRWYVKDKSLLDFYLKDIGPNAKTSYIDVPSKDVNKYLVENSTERLGGRTVKSFSRDPKNEFFLPKDLTKKSKELKNAREEAIRAKDAVDTLMDGIYNKYKQVGVDINYLDKYFPRLLKKGRYKKLAEDMGADPRSPFAQILKQKEEDKAFRKDLGKWVAEQEMRQGKQLDLLDIAMRDEFKFGWEPRREALTEREMNNLLNSYLKGITPEGLKQPSASKSRVLETVPDELLDHYGSIEDMLTSYIDHAAHTINIRKFFGKHITHDSNIDADVDASIGSFVRELLDNGEIHLKDVDKLANPEKTGLLQARFGYKPTPELNQDIKNLFYMTRLGQIRSAATQFGDVGVSAYVNGWWNTMKGFFGKERMSRQTLGITKVAEEFGTTSSTANALNHVFKYSGFKAVDNLGKKTFINAALRRNEELVSSAKGLEKFKKKWEPYFGNETDNLIADLQKGKVTDNVKLLMFNELSDVQPISLLEMPKAYLMNPNGRMFYAMKTFTIKQLDLLRRDALDKITKGDPEGATNLMRYVMMVTAANMGADKVKATLAGQEVEMEDAFIANLWRNFGVSSYLVNMASEQNKPAAAIAEALLSNPWVGGVQVADTLYQDFQKFSGLMDMEVWKYVPAFKGLPGGGQWLYNMFGGGAEKYAQEQKLKRDRGAIDEDEENTDVERMQR